MRHDRQTDARKTKKCGGGLDWTRQPRGALVLRFACDWSRNIGLGPGLLDRLWTFLAGPEPSHAQMASACGSNGPCQGPLLPGHTRLPPVRSMCWCWEGANGAQADSFSCLSVDVLAVFNPKVAGRGGHPKTSQQNTHIGGKQAASCCPEPMHYTNVT